MRQFCIISPDNSNTNFHCRSYERYHYKENLTGHYHMHSFSEIFFVTEGDGFFLLKDKKIPIHRGMVVINNGDTLHTEASHPSAELEYAVLCVENLSFLSSNKKEESTFFLDFSKDYDTVFDFIRLIEWEWNVREPFWQCALQTEFNRFILFVLRKSNLLALPVQTASSPNPLANVHLYLTANFGEDITLDKLSDIFCMNKYYLAHTFKKIYGDSIMHTLNQIRCQTAKNLLESSNYPINEISTVVGFNSCSYFSKTYRKIYGETPMQTRNSYFKEKR